MLTLHHGVNDICFANIYRIQPAYRIISYRFGRLCQDIVSYRIGSFRSCEISLDIVWLVSFRSCGSFHIVCIRVKHVASITGHTSV